MLTETRSRMCAIFAGLPPYSGIMLSTSRTSAPNATRRRAMAEPMRPSPPVITARVPAYPSSRGSDRNVTPPRPLSRHSPNSGDSYSHRLVFHIHGTEGGTRKAMTEHELYLGSGTLAKTGPLLTLSIALPFAFEIAACSTDTCAK